MPSQKGCIYIYIYLYAAPRRRKPLLLDDQENTEETWFQAEMAPDLLFSLFRLSGRLVSCLLPRRLKLPLGRLGCRAGGLPQLNTSFPSFWCKQAGPMCQAFCLQSRRNSTPCLSHTPFHSPTVGEKFGRGLRMLHLTNGVLQAFEFRLGPETSLDLDERI